MADERLIEKLEAMVGQMEELEVQLGDPEVMRDHGRVAELARKRAALEGICGMYRGYREAAREAAELREMAGGEEDEEMRRLAREEAVEVEGRAEELMERIKGELVTADDRAVGSVILEIRAGVGGDEAGIWAGDLLGMYERYAAEQGWRWEVMSYSESEMGGYKHAIVSVKGDGVWQHLGYEGGTHCVKRVPATESQGRIHTSTATVAVLAEPEKVEVVVDESEVEMNITTSQGPGGQNVNKVATAVKLRHRPTGIEVSMQDTKSQKQNKEKAWALLRARLYEHYQRQKDAERAEVRSAMIGRGERGERIRTYRYKDNLCVDHRVDKGFNLGVVMSGGLGEVVAALMEMDKAQRLAAL